MRTTGGEVLARILKIEGVDVVFGIIDGTYFGFYSALHRLGIRLITPRHEASAAHAAAAYARLTGRLGVCMASNGPGVANILPGLVVEQAEGNRVLCITSARRTGAMYPLRTGTYQGFDQQAVVGSFAKFSRAVPSFDRIPELMRAALRACWDGRPGVVHLDVPENLMNGEVKAVVPTWQPSQYRRTTPLAPDARDVERAADLLLRAELPLIHAGSGVIHAQAHEALRTVAELLEAPVTTSWAARGVFDEESPLALPMTHVKLNTLARNDADTVLIVGSRVGETDWWGKAPYWRLPSEQKTIQVDVDEAIIGANKPADVAIVADAGVFLPALRARLEARRGEMSMTKRRAALARYREHVRRYEAKLARALGNTRAPVHSAHAPALVRELFPAGSPLVADGGNTAVWSMFYTRAHAPARMLSTMKMGMLGAGMGQAVGAAVAVPDHPVACLIGDGAAGMHPQEIETAVRHKLRIVWLVLCDKQWGMVKMTQSIALRPVKMLLKKRLDADENIWTDVGEIDFAKLAESMGAAGTRVNEPAALRQAIVQALAHDGPTVIHVDVDPTVHMWAPGLIHFKAMHQEPKGT
ncbi:MAG: thiamine pyrophosphate-binding protein [Gemmatimonadaceae bacterium]|jgi:acetolactate synthase-1/2/3 large subunit|nr:thiamine pyrophosphate-binding protein [Gemmatimonadota bacterium]MBK9410234.1 thiamine pyrophosphate-binding protein [Gemmatimonadota bacterium]MCC7324962.1 thiamine pyrophosphate-binding protein [Gemmatimonadaceae bacterium]